MDFSEPFKLTARSSSITAPSSTSTLEGHRIVKYSPDGKLIANAVQFRLIVRDAIDSLQITQLFTCLDAIVSLDWSPDSRLIMCLMPRRSLIQIWSVDQSEWSCKIEEGTSGLKSAIWTPDSLHVLTRADFDVRLTVWSLTSKAVAYVKHLSKAGNSGLAFSPDGRYMALAERRDCKDALSIFDLASWSLVKHFASSTRELGGVRWKPTSGEHVLVVWESFFFGFDLILYSLSGDILGRFAHDDFRGSLIQKSRVTSLGAGTAQFSPCGQLLAASSSDPGLPSLLLLNSLTWRRIVEFPMTSLLFLGSSEAASLEINKEKKRNNNNKMDHNERHPDAILYKEISKKVPVSLGPSHPLSSADVASLGTIYANRSRYETTTSGHVTIPTVALDPDKVIPSPLVEFRFSPDSLFLASRTETIPNAVWVWDVCSLRLCALLVHVCAVKSFSWAPASASHPRLAIVTGSQNLFMWTQKGALSVQVPTDSTLDISSLSWSTDGASVALVGRDSFCLCFCKDKTPMTEQAS